MPSRSDSLKEAFSFLRCFWNEHCFDSRLHLAHGGSLGASTSRAKRRQQAEKVGIWTGLVAAHFRDRIAPCVRDIGRKPDKPDDDPQTSPAYVGSQGEDDLVEGLEIG